MKKIFLKLKNDTSGVSLIISIIFVAVFILILGGLGEIQLRTLRSLGDAKREAHVRDLTEASQEMAAYFAASHEVGQDTSTYTAVEMQPYYNTLYSLAAGVGVPDCAPTRTQTAPDLSIGGGLGGLEDLFPGSGPPRQFTTFTPACASFRVISKSETRNNERPLQIVGSGNTRYFSIPAAIVDATNTIRGTGDAARECARGSEADANDPCHWNKLSVGESVEIPLYYIDRLGNPVKINLADPAEFTLRVRTPCIGYDRGVERCAESERLELYPKITDQEGRPYRNVIRDPVLMQWIISDGNNTLVANSTTNVRPFPDANGVLLNTEISAGKINDANPYGPIGSAARHILNNYRILEKDYMGKVVANRSFPSIEDYINNDPQIIRPLFHLSFVGQPRRLLVGEDAATLLNSGALNDRTRDVPYLEYQILYSSTEGMPDAKSIATIWSEIGDFRREIIHLVKRAATLGGFALENL